MSENKKLELLEQYDDVTFALLMDEYAEEEGARLRKEFEEAQAAGEVSDTSDSLDEKCLQMIHRDFAKKRGKDNVRKIIRMTSKVAVAVMVFFGVAATTIMSVDALRIPVLDFIVEHFSEYSSITFEDNTPPSMHFAVDSFENSLPDGYTLVSHTITENLTLVAYQNENGDIAQLNVTPAKGEIRLDTDGAIYSEIELYNYKAILLEENGYQVFWHDENANVVYTVQATALTKEQIIDICYALAIQPE